MPSAAKPATHRTGNGVAKKAKVDSIAMLEHPAAAMDSAPDSPDALALQPASGEPPLAFLQLLLLMQALGREPDGGWYRATGLTRERVAELCRRHAGKLIGLRLVCAAMQVLSDDDLAALTRATLVDRLLMASIENDTAAMLKLVDKAAAISMRARLAPAARPAAPAAKDEPAAQPPRECSVAEAVAEARLILNALSIEKQLGAEALEQLSQPLELLEAPEEASSLQLQASSKKEERASSCQLPASSKKEDKKAKAAAEAEPDAGQQRSAFTESWKLEASSSLPMEVPVPIAEALAGASIAAPVTASGEVRK